VETQVLRSLKFRDKVVVITGSGTGIGQAIAKKYAENGAHIVIMGRRKEPLDDTLGLLLETMKNAGSDAKVKSFPGVDVSNDVSIDEMYREIGQEFGKVDIIVNNAGISGPVKAFTNASYKEFKECVAIHLTGTFCATTHGIRMMQAGGKIITVSTFFTEENKFEQRPYRFRAPYTSAQGSKNRLSEALAWELAEAGYRSIATNPGPVHSDRIYKTVYPKAAAEFLRIGGFQGLSSLEIEKATKSLLDLLDKPEPRIRDEISRIANEILEFRRNSNSERQEPSSLVTLVSELLRKLREIAEKIQSNTSKMIVDGEFLTQDDVANMVLNLSEDRISKLINGRIVPNDRVFYPVKPLVGTAVLEVNQQRLNFLNKVFVITITSNAEKELERAFRIATELSTAQARQVIVLSRNPTDMARFKAFHYHSIDLSDERSVRMIFETVKTKFGGFDALIHITGEYDYNLSLLSVERWQWDLWVDNFINIPGLIVKEAVNIMASPGAIENPASYRGSHGCIVIIGPDSPVGNKVSGLVRARSEIFRGALRPYTATVNQELRDVLGSKMCVYLLLPGNIAGSNPSTESVTGSVTKLLTEPGYLSSQVIFYLDE
jgi:NAD(P)-dependent dehydrogenase (short-subunit alcohol dehydrogenase family)